MLLLLLLFFFNFFSNKTPAPRGAKELAQAHIKEVTAAAPSPAADFVPRDVRGDGLDVVKRASERTSDLKEQAKKQKGTTKGKERGHELDPKKKQAQGVKSAVWVFFRMAEKGEDQSFVYCIACDMNHQESEGNAKENRVKISDYAKKDAKPFLKTGNFKSHVKNVHGTWWKVVKKTAADGRSAKSAFDSLMEASKPQMNVGRQSTLNGFAKKMLREPGKLEKELRLVVWIVRNNIAFEALKDPEWTEMLECWGVSISDVDTLKEHLFPLYVIALRLGEAKIRNAGAYSVAVDYWTSFAKQKYLAISYHFAGTDMKVHSLLLDVVPVSASANAPLTSQVILERVDKHFVHSRQLFGPKK